MMQLENELEERKRKYKMMIWALAALIAIVVLVIVIFLITQSNHVTAPAKNDDVFEGMNYRVVKEQFEKAGFENIELIPLKDKKKGDSKIGQVTEVTINGDDDFSDWSLLGGTKLATYDSDDMVIIEYHSQK